MRPGTRGVLRMIMSGFAAAALAGGLVTCVAFPAAAASAAGAGRHHPHVLLVGTFNGVPGRYQSIQAAVNAAGPGDWILVAPGDYHERADETGPFGNPALVPSTITVLRFMPRSVMPDLLMYTPPIAPAAGLPNGPVSSAFSW